ncbi:MAG: transcriptional regulator [Thermoanaerobaculia bacterium]|nr:transcriptional regulator [Thermoanaerobaculia bacterium]
MSLTKHRLQQLVIIAEAALEKELIQTVKRLGAHGYTVAEVRAGGLGGDREGAWEADRTIRMEVICRPAVADEIAEHVLAVYAPHYGVSLFFTAAEVIRPERF